MKILFLIPLLLATLTSADKAPKIKKNPKDIVAIADFPFGGDKEIKGNVIFTAKQGSSVNVHFDMTGFPADGAPYYYHIHENSVPANGDCEAVGLHFNPYNASPDCPKQKHDGYCQVGDLSGKHGLVNTTCFELKFEDPYLSLNKKSKSYIVGRSLVFHYKNMTKLACADIELADDIKLQNLILEYTQSDDLDQLQELRTPIEEGYTFDELEALSAETYEELEIDELSGVAGQDEKNKHLDKNKNFTDESLKPHWNISKNYTNLSTHGVSTDCENSSPSYTSLITPVILGFFAGMFI
ncbi:uncharacterized protein J8A68_003060 [[Candida] subhashii]|uniref:superoxide dismutase n=1 Tax=[Candida] subhashii TaxID=561895 RepID=A0A8J5UI67_9ASCO|nr:uncharacterized protein J8A68_003060 [[Candida] subhashii]KAG7663408.1 hypothetical protein J8A68_003060 [[Candida] subhashii]